ncbi:MAG TPA: DUF2071 domain-containing protein [Candidatus Acidoferrales bacterium]|jgi:uncharacterized protein YqjF (DUF2071 family)|nr:DUF2071 domain-containing protein [Candidatus Acidoferrales bacterium]
MPRPEKIFLSAEWRDLVMLNYEADPACVQKYVPPGTELDSFAGKTYVSLVGFRFCRTKLLGSIPIPFHTEFEEINLRFYVRRSTGGETRRGVVFIAEIVPKRAVAFAARWFYGENYVRRPMAHRVHAEESNLEVQYSWRSRSHWCKLQARAVGAPSLPAEASLEQFITEHYWGYSRQPNAGTVEYHVSHAPWKVWSASHAEFSGDTRDLYGDELSQLVKKNPASAFIADGSPVKVLRGCALSS